MQITRLDDAADPRLADYRALTDVALRRRQEPEHGLYIAESAKVITRALQAGHRPRSVLIQERWISDIERVLGPASDVEIFVVPAAVAEAVTGYSVHRGALASMHRPALSPVRDVLRGARTVVVLEDIVDHTNVGAIFRSVAGLGADAVLISPGCADPLYRRSVRVSMGTVFQVPWTRYDSPEQLRAELAAQAIQLAALSLAEDSIPLDEYVMTAPPRVALMLGTEGDGLSTAAVTTADATVTIPMAGGVDSLNVAAAGAVAIWALTRR